MTYDKWKSEYKTISLYLEDSSLFALILFLIFPLSTFISVPRTSILLSQYPKSSISHRLIISISQCPNFHGGSRLQPRISKLQALSLSTLVSGIYRRWNSRKRTGSLFVMLRIRLTSWYIIIVSTKFFMHLVV